MNETAHAHPGTSRKANKPAMVYIQSPNYSSRNGVPIKRVVLHYTTTRIFDSTVSWFSQTKSGVSAHYVVGREGQIAQMVSDERKAWHAPVANADSIGIEFSAERGDKLTNAQSIVARALVRYLAEEYHLTSDNFTGHKFLGQSTDCPGSLWSSVDELRAWVADAIDGDVDEPNEPDEPPANLPAIVLPYAPCMLPLPWPKNLILRRNFMGADVYSLQCALIGLDYLEGPPKSSTMVGNYFNKHVEYAVREFQKDFGLERDGVVGPITRAMVQSVLEMARKTKPPVDFSVATLTIDNTPLLHDGAWSGLRRLKLAIGDTSFSVASGARGAQTFRRPEDKRSTPGNLEPLPQGKYAIGSIEFAGGKDNYEVSHGNGLGPVWVALDADFSDDRGSFGCHLDSNIGVAAGSAGCVVFPNVDELKRFVAALRKHNPSTLVVAWGL